MLSEYKNKYTTLNFITFGLTITQEYHEKENVWKKKIGVPKNWVNFTLDNELRKIDTCLGMITGKINNVFVVDIDNVGDWKKLLKKYKQEEPETVKAISGNGGFHLYFKYDEKLNEIKNTSKSISDKYDIDVRTNGGFIIIPPSKYFNNTLDKEVEYVWERSIFDHDMLELPEWLFNLFSHRENNKTIVVKPKELKPIKNNILNDMELSDSNETLNNDINYDETDIVSWVNMLGKNRYQYSDWLNVGICLYNMNQQYLYIWDNWSKKNSKYQEGICEEKWSTFTKKNNGLNIGSLVLWIKEDSPIDLKNFNDHQSIKKVIKNNKNIFPKNQLQIDKIISNETLHHVILKDRYCPMYKNNHDKNNVYLEISPLDYVMKCHLCVGKRFPCKHTQLEKKDMVVINNTLNVENLQVNIYNNNDNLDNVNFGIINMFDNAELNKVFSESLIGTNTLVAEFVFQYNKNNFNYTCIKEGTYKWYTFDGSRWKTGTDTSLKLFISKKIPELYDELINNFKNDTIKIQKLNKLKQNCQTAIQINSIIICLETLFKDKDEADNFYKKLDKNNNLIGFENGVYDLEKEEFRNGKPDDFISMSVGYNYINNQTDKINDLKTFLSDIQPEESELRYLLTYLSIGLKGNLLELFTILTGTGRNGKSKIIELLKETFGDYFGSVDSQMFTRPRPDANSPVPMLMNLLKKRIVVTSEPEKNCKLNTGFIKFITGRDCTSIRNCHQNDMIDFTGNFITLFACNDIPDVDEMDSAISKRLRCINFTTEFVDNPTETHHKKINTRLNENFKYWKADFILLLIETYKEYKKNQQLIPTTNILEWTNRYKEQTDIYFNYLNEKTEHSEKHVHISTLFENFKIWYKTNNPNTKIPSNKDFSQGIKKHKSIERCVKVDNKVTCGVKNLKLIEDD